MECKLVSSDTILSEINAVIGHAAENGRNELNAEEIEYITRITKRMVKDTKMQLGGVLQRLDGIQMEQSIIHQIKETL